MKSGKTELLSFIVYSSIAMIKALPSPQTSLHYEPFQTTMEERFTPNYLTPCSRRNKRFNFCVKTTLQTFFNAIVHGSKELSLPPTDPLKVPEMKIVEGSGDVILKLTLRDVSILGLRDTRIVSVRSNLEFNKFEISLKYPRLNILGNFKGEGGVKTFPIVGDGSFYFNMTDVSAAWIIYLKESDDFGDRHFKIDSFLIDIIPVEISARFGNSIDGDNALGSALNGFFNENAQEIFKMTKPKITDALSVVFTNFANEVLSRFSSETLLPP